MFKLSNGQSCTDESANLMIDQASVSWIWDRRVLGKTSSISFQVVIFRKSSALIENICLPVQPMSTFFNTHCMEKNAKTDKEAHIARQGKLCQWYDIRYGNSFYGVESIDVARRLWGTIISIPPPLCLLRASTQGF